MTNKEILADKIPKDWRVLELNEWIPKDALACFKHTTEQEHWWLPQKYYCHRVSNNDRCYYFVPTKRARTPKQIAANKKNWTKHQVAMMIAITSRIITTTDRQEAARVQILGGLVQLKEAL